MGGEQAWSPRARVALYFFFQRRAGVQAMVQCMY
jgi:hypothetical protein